MGIKTGVNFADSTTNPIMGCSGCELYPDHCYAAALCRRHAGRKGWPKSFDSPEYFHGRLEKAIRWSDLTGADRPDKPWLNGYPRIIFVNDVGDGFCPDVDPGGWLWPRLEIMEESPHIWLLLTKWPDRMREFFASIGGAPDNFWLGTSVLRQRDLWRLDELLQIKASIHWASLEPMLGAIGLRQYLDGYERQNKRTAYENLAIRRPGGPFLNWIIIGAESGPGARPMRPDWVRMVRDDCQKAAVSFFFKQWGDADPGTGNRNYHRVAGWHGWEKRGGRLLDGREWSELPELERIG